MYRLLIHFVRSFIALSILTLLMVFTIYGISNSEVLFSDTPDWQGGAGTWPSGIAWGDIDNNGWLDLVTGVGIDLSTLPDHVYYNYNGHLSTTAGWTSEYGGYSACVQLGDLDNDGDIDMVVPGVGLLGIVAPVSTVIYYNDNGFPANPDYFTEPTINVWSLDLGDIDGDGDLDMVLPDCGIAVNARSIKIYYNNGGTFNTTPDWESDLLYRSVDAEFADIDLDGDLDLVAYGYNGLQIFDNLAGVLETTPSWTTTAASGGFQIAIADYNNDNYPDIAVSCGNSGGSIVGFSVFENVSGTVNTVVDWTNSTYQGAGVSWGDMDDDGDLDLVGCGWLNNPVGIFENVAGVLSDEFVWSENADGTQLAILADYDEDMLVETTKNITADGTRKLFTLEEVPIHEISLIEIDGVPLDYSQYCYHLETGWISMASPPVSGSEISIHYAYSRDLDIAIGGSSAWIYNNRQSTLHLPTYTFTSTEFVDDGEDGFFDSGETTRFYFTLNNEHTTDHNVTVTMTSSNPDIVFTNQSVFFSVIDGDNTTVNNLSEPFEYIIPEMEEAVFDTFFISIESDLGTYRDQFQFIQETGRTEILLIDDDGGESCEDIFYDDLFDLNIPSHTWTTGMRDSPGVADLDKYRIVFWFTGEETADCLQTDDINAMKGYLDGGGNLFLSGLGLAGELSLEDPAFLENYLHCSYVQDRSYHLHDGLEETLFDGIQIRLSTMQTLPGMEKISAMNGGQPVLKFGNTATSYSAISFVDYNRVIFITWGYELISNSFTDQGFASRTEVMQRILDFFPAYICGDVDGLPDINILDIVFLLNYKYKGGPAPDPINAADVDGVPPVNILDIVYLLNYKYKNGPEPACP